MSDAFRSLEDRRSRVEQVRENSTRPGRAFRHYESAGAGFTVEADVFDFEVAFIELPNFTFGASLSEAHEPPAEPPSYCAGVYRWRKSARGFYTGAWCWFTVTTGLEETAALGIHLTYSLVWEGVASKDILSTPGFPVNKLDV